MVDGRQIVYISCVEEVRYSFVSHLSEALRRKGINEVFVDSNDLLSNESQSVVEGARVSVMVLPGNRTVCLDKLMKVLECQKNNDQVVVPVVYGVRSSEVEWLSALNSKGFSSIHQSREKCSDSQLVKEIVRDVYEKLFYMERIGIYSKLLEIENIVCKQPFGIRSVGIWGMPGIGKTTLAKAVFDQMSGSFDAYCFIADYTKAIQEKGLYRLLEEQFLTEMAGGKDTITQLSLLRDKLNKRRVLVVLDDVRNSLAVESFLRGFDWFGPKSLIIITSRDKQVFRLCRVNHIYEVNGLNEKDALQLFSLSASLNHMTEQNLHEVSMKVIKHANGHPLALTIYGRELKGKKRPSEMETAFLKLKKCPPAKFVDAIKSCYDTLNDTEKNIFLDIACFFSGEDLDYVMPLLEGCGFFPYVGIDVLVEKCLVAISENRVWMHNLIQDVGRQIINRDTEQTKRRIRLWEPWCIKFLLENHKQKENREHETTFKRAQGTEEIEGMFLDTSNGSFDIKHDAFENMPNLRYLKIYCSSPEANVIKFLKGSLYSLPNELRLLHWENYPLQFLPQKFDPMHLIEINMPYSHLKKLWGGNKNLEMLRTIRLCHSQQLVDIDDLLKAKNLEVIDLQGCTKLQSFPATGQLLHLRVVNISGCTEIKSFPEIPPNIETLRLQGTGIIELPLSIVKPSYKELLNLLAEIPGLSGVSNLEQSDLKPLTSLMNMSASKQILGKLICLELNDCTRLRGLPDMDTLESLKVLDLSGCSELETIRGFPRNLKELYLTGTTIRQVPQLPQRLEFYAHGCASLKSICFKFVKFPVRYTFSNCFDLSPQVVSHFLIEALANAEHIPRECQQEFNKVPAFSFCVPSHGVQNSILGLQPGPSVMTRLNSSWRNTLVGFAMLVEVAFLEGYCDATRLGIRCVCKWKNKKGHSQRIERILHCWAPGKAVPKVQKDHMFVFFDVNMRPSTDEGNDLDICADLVVFEFFPVSKQTKPLDDCCRVRRCGVRVITAANCDKSLENISPLDPMELFGNNIEEVLRVNYENLKEMDKVLFLYISCLFNDEDVSLVAPLIASIDLDVTSGLKVLAGRSLISVSSSGEIGMHFLLRQMGKKFLHKRIMLPGSSKKSENLVESSQGSTITHAKNPQHHNHIQVRSSKYLSPAQELLSEFCSVGVKKTVEDLMMTNNKIRQKGKQQEEWDTSSINNDQYDQSATALKLNVPPLHSLKFMELHIRKAKLLSMLEKLKTKYGHYREQMGVVVSSLEASVGVGAAEVYTELASRYISRHFRCLKDCLVGQIIASSQAMGEREKDNRADSIDIGAETQRLSPSAKLRAWLFEHFLHPYPSDVDMHILAGQTGLSRSQVSDWFITARVGLWEPMIEEMYQEETRREQKEITDPLMINTKLGFNRIISESESLSSTLTHCTRPVHGPLHSEAQLQLKNPRTGPLIVYKRRGKDSLPLQRNFVMPLRRSQRLQNRQNPMQASHGKFVGNF